MICNICGAHEATIHLTEIINEQMIEVHLCETCAEEKGTDFKTHFNFGDLLTGLTNPEKMQQQAHETPVLRCPECQMVYEEFAKSGRLGCAACYEAFSTLLFPLIKRVQRSLHHLGKRPGKPKPGRRKIHNLQTLQERLRKCIQQEEFEEAARLRDEIKHMEEKRKKGKKK